jgi:glucose-fructose oxidoreductase
MQVKPDNIRLDGEMGGGPLWDIGIYCINAARYLLRDNPVEVIAASARGRDRRFSEVDEAVSAVMRFPGERLASFTCSFGAADTASYRIVGTKGDLVVEPAFEYEEALEHCLTIEGRCRQQSFSRRDQFAPELIYFARCVREGIEPEPGGAEGLIDTAIIEAIEESCRTGRSVRVGNLPDDTYPDQRQEQRKRPARKAPPVLAEAAHAD